MKGTGILNPLMLVILSICSLSTRADPNDGLLTALQKKDFHEAARIFSEHTKTINPDRRVLEGEFKGASVLWLAAWDKQWLLVERMLALSPQAEAWARPDEGPGKGKPVFNLVAESGNEPLKKLLAIHEMNRDILHSPLTQRPPPLRGVFEGIFEIFRKATVAFTNFIDDSGIREVSDFDRVPNELTRMFVLRYLRTEDPDFAQLPDDMLLTLLGRFHKVYKDVDYKGRSIEVVAAKVLSRLAPIKDRKDVSAAQIKSIKKRREWIIDEITSAIKAKRLPEQLDQYLRDRLADALSSTSLSAMTRKWVKQTVVNLAEQQQRDEATDKPNVKKRERGEENPD